MSFWDQVNDADPSGAGQYFEPGEHVAEVLRISSRKGHKGLSFIAEFEVKSTNNPGLTPGSRRSFVRNLSKPDTLSMALGDIKGLLLALFNVDSRTEYGKAFAEKCGALTERAIGAGNPLSGALVCISVFVKKTKAGSDFSNHVFMPVTIGVTAPPNYRYPSVDAVLAAVAAPPMVPGTPAGYAAAAPPPPPPPDPSATWARDPTGRWKLNPATNAWLPV